MKGARRFVTWFLAWLGDEGTLDSVLLKAEVKPFPAPAASGRSSGHTQHIYSSELQRRSVYVDKEQRPPSLWFS